jgi:hypothetical protein
LGGGAYAGTPALLFGERPMRREGRRREGGREGGREEKALV